MSDWERIPNDEGVPESKGQSRSALILTRGLAAVYLIGALPFLHSIPGSLRGARTLDWTSAFDVFITMMTLVVLPLLIISGIGLIMKRPWARALAVVGPVLATMGGATLLVQTPEFGAVFVWIFLALSTAVIWYYLSRPYVAEFFAGEPRPDDNFLRSVLIALAVVVVLTGVTGLIVFEVPRIGQELRLAGWERDCEGGNANSCGMLALYQLREGNSLAEMKEGLEGFGEVCERDYVMACRKFAYAHGYIDRSGLKGNANRIMQSVAEKNLDACMAGDGRSCFLTRFVMLGRVDSMAKRLDAVFAVASEKCGSDDEWACAAIDAQFSKDGPLMTDDARVAHCEAGFTTSCSWVLWNKVEGANELVTRHCREFPASRSCLDLIDASSGETADRLARKSCNEGHLAACGTAARGLPDELEHRDAIAAIYGAMSEAAPAAQRLAHDVGFWLVEPPDFSGFEEACEAGVPEACFGLGVQLSGPARGEYEPPLNEELIAEYERSFGRACELGMNAGCLAMAERLRNRPIGEEVDVERSNAFLATACERGHRTACWLVDIRDELLRGEYETYEKMLVQACRAQTDRTGERGPCRELAFFWSYREGRTPWLLSERLANAYVRPICKGGDKWSCAWSGWNRPEPNDRPLETSALPWHVEDFSALERSCKKEHLWSCSLLLRLTKMGHPGVSAEQARELERRVCKVLPETDGCAEP